MNQQFWQEIESTFHQALELPKEQQLDFVQTISKGRPNLEFEVLTLLKSHHQEARFLDCSSGEDWTDALNHLAERIQTETPPSYSNSTSSQPSSPSACLTKSVSQSSSERHYDSSINQTLIDSIESTRPELVVKKVINRGGMGTVLRVYQRKLNRDVAIKLLSTTFVDSTLRKRFIRESQAAAQVKNDHVIQIHEVFSDPEIPFLVMELIEGPSLKRFIETNKTVVPEWAAELARQIAIGLSGAHEQHLVHRDVKPGNVLLSPVHPSQIRNAGPNSLHYRAKLIDFGLARDIDNPTGETKDQMHAGTLAYMSPEQLNAPETVDHRSDIYGLGMTLYEMLTGERPFRGAPHMVIKKIEHSEPPAPRKFDDRIPKDLESICLKAISKDRTKRYETASDFSDDLSRFLEGRATLARPITTFEKALRLIKQNRSLATLAALAATFLILLTVGSLIFATTVAQKNQTILKQKSATTDSQVQRIVDSQPGALLFAVDEVIENPIAQEKLIEQFNDQQVDFDRRFNAAVALSQLGTPKSDFIVSNLDRIFLTPEMAKSLTTVLRRCPDAVPLLNDSLKTVSCSSEILDHATVQAVACRIILLAHLGDFKPWIDAAIETEDPTVCTEIIHLYAKWRGDLTLFLDSVADQQNVDLNWTLCQAFSLMDRRSIKDNEVRKIQQFCRRLTSDPEYVVATNAQYLLNAWSSAEEPIENLEPVADSNWYQLSNRIRMVAIEPSTSLMGRIETEKKFIGYPPHQVTITRPFFLSDTEITVEEFLEFVRDPDCKDAEKITDAESWNHSEILSPTKRHPINNVNWYDSAKFCNWLSRRENLQPFYTRLPGSTSFEVKSGNTVTYENWSCDHSANGYRLPNEHEFELGCRDRSTTKYSFGTNRKYREDYFRSSNHTRIPTLPVRSKLSNRLGLYDTTGNIWERTNDWHCLLDESSLTDPIGGDGPVEYPYGKSIRGGGVGSSAGDNDAESRGHASPERRSENLGFRIARYADRLPLP